MNFLDLLLVGLFVCSVLSIQTQSPAWIINPNMDAGEVVCVNGANPATFMLTPTTKTINQHFNKTTFTITPNVILSMIGYSHSAPSLPTDLFGFRILITNVSMLNFTYSLTTYGCQVYDLRYLYLAIQYDTASFYMGSVTQTFNSSSNLANATALQRWQTFMYTNPFGWSNNNFSPTNTQIIAFPTGFQIMAQSGWSYFGINATVLNSTSYSVNISTSGNNILYFIDFSIIMFNSADISANYSVYDDIMMTSVVGNSTTYYPPVISASQYMFRNCLTGAVDISFKVTGVALVWYYYGYSSTNNDYLVWRTFNNRVRSCPANFTYYNPGTSMCQDVCEPYYNANTTYKLCLPCAYSCYNCSQANSASSCTVCSVSDSRALSGTSCLCNHGYYDNGVAVCAPCNYRCLTCTSGTLTSCISCSSTLFRTFNAVTSECLCNTGYYENNTCMACQTNSVACTSCSFNTSTSTFKCLTCDSSLFRTLESVLSKCVCQTGYYEDSSLTCKSCSVGCLACSYNGVNSICTTCDSSLSRSMATGNLSCYCILGYYQNANGTCSICPVGCLSCSFNGTVPICSSCNSFLNRTMDSSNTSCPCLSAYYLELNDTCKPCQLGCLACSYNGSNPICSSCDSSLSRIIGAGNLSCDCQAGYYQDANITCSVCPIGCISCTFNGATPICASCNSVLNRTMGSGNISCPCLSAYYQGLNDTCKPCTVGCLVCSFNGTNSLCISCDGSMNRVIGTANLSCDCQIGFYLNANGTCSACPTGCLSCSFNGTTPICASCNSPNRTMGSGNISCPCLSAFYEDATSTCQPCQLGCLTCALVSSTVTCSFCDSSLIRVLSSSNTSCTCMNGFYQNNSHLCAACQKGCLTCYSSSSSSLCTSCDSVALRIMGSSNITCDCQQGTYQATNISCLNCPIDCTSCSLSGSNVICSACLTGFYPNGSGVCTVCSVGCLNCQFDVPTSSQVCLNCSTNLNFTLQSSSCACVVGTVLVGNSCIVNSTNTTNNTNTTNTTNSTTNGTNTNSNCGNGLLQSSESCDDGNIISLDGCSSSCQVEQYHTCINNNTLYSVSLCYYSNKIQLNPSLIYKIPGKNTVELHLKVIAPLCNSDYLKNYLEQTSYLALYDKTRLLYEQEGKRLLQGSLSWISIPAKTISYDPVTKILTIVFDYDVTIDLSQKQIQFIPSSSTTTSGVKYFYASPTAQLTLSQPYNNLSTVYYSSQELNAVKSMRYLFLVLIVFQWIFFILTLIRKKGVIGTECMLVLQITYLALIDQEKIVQGWSGLQLTGRYTIGFNPKLLDNAYEADLYALEIDSNLINVLNITLGLILLLFVLLIVFKIYNYIENKRTIKKLMEMDVSQQHQSVKDDKPQIKTFDKVMVYVVDALLSLLFLAIGVFMIAILFTNSSNLVNNIIEAAIISITLIIFWILFYQNRQSYTFKNISYLKIIINANKTSFNPKIKFIIQNYYIIVYGLWMAAALLMSLVRNVGIAAYAMIIFGCICAMIFHIRYKIFFEILDSRRCIVNNAALIVLMLISLFSSILGSQLGVGLSIVIVTFCILLLLLVFNAIIFMILQKKRIKVEKQQEIHDEEMKQMDNELAMANISFIGKGYNSINKSRDFTKDKEFFNSLEFTSTRKKVLLDDQNKIVALIEDKIKELKDFKKDIQGQLDISRSQQMDLPENSENNATIQNVLGELGLVDVDELGNQMNEI